MVDSDAEIAWTACMKSAGEMESRFQCRFLRDEQSDDPPSRRKTVGVVYDD